jgi:hypothetical protein
MFDEKRSVQKVGARTPILSSAAKNETETAKTAQLGSIGGNRDQKA